MPRATVSKDELLKTAKEIVFQEGVDQLNIRHLAQRCGIAVGSVYNCFPSKSALLLAVVEDFWRAVFHTESCAPSLETDFLSSLEGFYQGLEKHLAEFKALFLGQLRLMGREEVAEGKAMEQNYFHHIHEGLLAALKQDGKIAPSVWSRQFTPEGLVSFLLSSIFLQLADGENDFAFIKEIVRRLLYP